MYTFKKVELEAIKNLRNKYFGSLYEPQELFLELMVPGAQIFLIRDEKEEIGYFIQKGNHLLEFFVLEKYLPNCSILLKKIINQFKVKNAYCKSFDSVLLKACFHSQKSMEIIGVLYRDYMETEINQPEDISEVRIASMSDYKDITIIKDEVFDNDKEVEDTIKNKAIFVFKNGDSLIGFGIFQPAVKGRNSYDIGMAVAPDYRRKGYGAFILNYLKNHCIRNNWRPTCGCAIENISSQKTIEKIGFVSKHNLLEFTF